MNHEFEYFALPQGSRAPLGCMVLVAPAAVAVLLGALDLTSYALPAAAAIAGGLLWRNRSQRARPHATLRVESANLQVLDKRLHEAASFPLQDLLDVELDTKTIQRVQDNQSAGVLPHFRLLHGQVGSASDVSRIVLVTPSGEIPLTDVRLSSSYTTESFGHLRKFLRNHGWLPESERSE